MLVHITFHFVPHRWQYLERVIAGLAEYEIDRVLEVVDSNTNDVSDLLANALRALALNAIAERDAVMAERDRLLTMNEKLRQLLRKAQGFEAKSERLAKLHPVQLNLVLEDIEQTIAKVEAIEEKTRTTNAPLGRFAEHPLGNLNRSAMRLANEQVLNTVVVIPADHQDGSAIQRMKRIGDHRFEGRNPGIMASARMTAPKIGPSSPRSSKQPNCPPSTRKLGSAMSSAV